MKPTRIKYNWEFAILSLGMCSKIVLLVALFTGKFWLIAVGVAGTGITMVLDQPKRLRILLPGYMLYIVFVVFLFWLFWGFN